MSNSFVVNGFPAWNDGQSILTRRIRPRNKIWAYWFPILTGLFSAAAFISGYTIAVAKNDELSWFSYISDGGALPIESCIFGIFLNYGAFFWFLTAVSKNIYLAQHMKFHGVNGWGWTFTLWLLLILGTASGIGITVVANFQETNAGLVHGLGAWVAFFGGVAYVWIYIILTVVIKPRIAPAHLTLVRVFLALVATFSLAVNMVVGIAGMFVKEGEDGKKPLKPKLNGHPVMIRPGEPWYVNHLITTTSEWILGLSFQLIILTFSNELRSFTVTALSTEELALTTEDPELKSIKSIK